MTVTRAIDLVPQETPLAILAEGCFGEQPSKTALGVIRYGQWPIKAVIDSTRAGKLASDYAGLRCDAPIVATLPEAIAHEPKALLLGTAPGGGQLPNGWREIIRQAIESKLHVISGLHTFLAEDAELKALADRNGVRLWDVRDPACYEASRKPRITLQNPRPSQVKVVASVGTDCAIGKMYTTLELSRQMQTRDAAVVFVPTGQTGILIDGPKFGLPLDRIIGDFMAGSLEAAIQNAVLSMGPEWTKRSWVFVEGQGSLLHPAYSGVTMALLHGANPDAMILCHKADLQTVRNYSVTIPPLKDMIALYEQTAALVRHPSLPPARIAGVSVNTSMLWKEDARKYMDDVEAELGLPVVDPVRENADRLVEALTKHFDAADNPSAGAAL